MVRVGAAKVLFSVGNNIAVRLFTLVLGLGLLSSCSVGPDYQKPELSVPAKWGDGKTIAEAQAEAKEAAPAGWWRQLNDPLLNRLVNAAIIGNLDVATAKARIREARAVVYQTSGVLMPSLDSDVGYKRQRATGGPTNDHYNGGFDSSWELDIFGGNRRAVEAAKAAFTASKEDLRATMVTLIGDVSSNYVEARRLQAQLRLTEEMARSQRETANLTDNKFEAGAISSLDAHNALGQAADMESNIPRLKAQFAVILHRLSILLGQPPAAIGNLIEPKGTKAGGIPQPPLRLPATIPADILLSRPDLRAAERRLAQSTAIIGEKEALRYPDISLTGNIATNSVRLGDLGKNSTIGWSFGPSLSLPLFRGGSLVAGVEIARAQRDQNFIAYRSATLNALEEVENALVSLKNDRQTALKKSEAAKAYYISLKLSRSLYESGNTDFLELLNAERSYYSAQQGTFDARAATVTDYISLMKALGGGWDGTVVYGNPEIIDKNTGPHFSKISQAQSLDKTADSRAF